MRSYIWSLSLIFISIPLFASVHTATLIYKKGDVQFLLEPSKEAHTGSGQVLFAERYYKIKPAKIGRKINLGEAVKVGPNGTAKLNFPNGDQFIVSAGTTFALTGAANTDTPEAEGGILNIFYGKMRAIISKKGPRNTMKIKTRGAIAGVRGTDFYISAAPEKISLTVLRGKVAIEKANGIEKPLIIETGMSANVKATKKDKKENTSPELIETSKKELIEIQQATKVELKDVLNNKDLDEKTRTEITALEEKAKESTLEDIFSENGGNQELLTQYKNVPIDKINSEVVFSLYKRAPIEVKNNKLKEADLKVKEEEIYKNYFK